MDSIYLMQIANELTELNKSLKTIVEILQKNDGKPTPENKDSEDSEEKEVGKQRITY